HTTTVPALSAASRPSWWSPREESPGAARPSRCVPCRSVLSKSSTACARRTVEPGAQGQLRGPACPRTGHESRLGGVRLGGRHAAKVAANKRQQEAHVRVPLVVAVLVGLVDEHPHSGGHSLVRGLRLLHLRRGCEAEEQRGGGKRVADP